MPVRTESIVRRAAVHCHQTAEDARAALGYFFVPTFPLNFNDPSQARIAAILKGRSESLLTLVDIDEDDSIASVPSNGADTTAAATPVKVKLKLKLKITKVTKVTKACLRKGDATDISESNIVSYKRPTRSRQDALRAASMLGTKKRCNIILRITPKGS